MYPINIETILLPDGEFPIYIPEESSVKKHWIQEKSEAGFPFWAKLWPSTIALSTFIQKNPNWIAGRKVAELAAGLGLPSLVAAADAKQVWCSDISPEAMQVAAKNAELHHLANIRFEACNWNHLPPDFDAEVVLLSDINYNPDHFEELETVLKKLLQAGCTLLLATPQRLMAKPLFEKLAPFIFDQFEERVDEKDSYVFISIFILKNRNNS